MDILFLLIVGIGVIYIFKKVLGGPSKDSLHPVDDGLTETQRRWRQMKQDEKQQKNSNLDEFDQLDINMTELNKQYSKEEIEDIRQVINQQAFINKHLRPFRFFEWLWWAVTPPQSRVYIFKLVLVAGIMIALPLMTTGYFDPILFFMVAIVNDIVEYYRWRLNEVKQMPEYKEKFTQNNSN